MPNGTFLAVAVLLTAGVAIAQSPGQQPFNLEEATIADQQQKMQAGSESSRAARAAAWHPYPVEGQHRDRGQDDDHRRISGAGRDEAAKGCVHRLTSARGRRGNPWQDESERMGEFPVDAFFEWLERTRRADEESIRVGPQSLRIELWFRRGCRREPRSGRRRHRNRRFDRVAVKQQFPGGRSEEHTNEIKS